MYEVIHFFTDLQDFNHPYEVGHPFPRKGVTVTEERLKELSGSNNKQHKPLIKLVEEQAKIDGKTIAKALENQKTYTKTEINRMSTGDLRILATEQGIENAEETNGADLKKMLIEKFGL